MATRSAATRRPSVAETLEALNQMSSADREDLLRRLGSERRSRASSVASSVTGRKNKTIGYYSALNGYIVAYHKPELDIITHKHGITNIWRKTSIFFATHPLIKQRFQEEFNSRQGALTYEEFYKIECDENLMKESRNDLRNNPELLRNADNLVQEMIVRSQAPSARSTRSTQGAQGIRISRPKSARIRQQVSQAAEAAEAPSQRRVTYPTAPSGSLMSRGSSLVGDILDEESDEEYKEEYPSAPSPALARPTPSPASPEFVTKESLNEMEKRITEMISRVLSR